MQKKAENVQDMQKSSEPTAALERRGTGRRDQLLFYAGASSPAMTGQIKGEKNCTPWKQRQGSPKMGPTGGDLPGQRTERWAGMTVFCTRKLLDLP